MSNFLPLVFDISNKDNKITTYDETPEFSQNIDYPKFSLGFHHFNHQSKTKMDITKEFEGKKKVYNVINQFERYVDDYEDSIGNVSQKYFKSQADIISRSFYKLWELFFMFDLIDLSEKNFVSAHLSEDSGSFVQATMFYRDQKDSKNDKYYTINVNSDHIPKLNDTFIDVYKKDKRLIPHKTYSTQEAGGSFKKDNGDLRNLKTIKLFGGNFDKKKANFITANGGINWKTDVLQEQDAFKLILSQIITAVQIQESNGTFVCKFYEMFTNITTKLLSILTTFYKKVYIAKPLMSRDAKSERFLVCLDFIDSKDNKTKISKLESILSEINNNHKLNIVDYFSEYKLDDVLKANIIRSNTILQNKQFTDINKMIVFINKQNFRGDEYFNYKEKQILASKYWISTFLPEKDFISARNKVAESTNNIIKDNKSVVDDVLKKIEF